MLLIRVRSSVAGSREFCFLFHRETCLHITSQQKSWVDLSRSLVGCKEDECMYLQENANLTD